MAKTIIKETIRDPEGRVVEVLPIPLPDDFFYEPEYPYREPSAFAIVLGDSIVREFISWADECFGAVFCAYEKLLNEGYTIDYDEVSIYEGEAI